MAQPMSDNRATTTEARRGLFDTLRYRRRPGEYLVERLLFLSGLVSILVTLFIIIELGSESRLFFTRLQWESANKTVLAEVGAHDTSFAASPGGHTLRSGDLIRIGVEELRVTAVRGTTVTVERGANGTTPAPLNAGADIVVGKRVSLREFFTGTTWSPQIGQFGIWPLVTATLMTSLIAVAVALPLGLAVAIYLSEYATERVRGTVKPVLEVLAGVPTVVYGYFALTFMTPLLRSLFGRDVVQIYNVASAGLTIGILILPLVSSMSEDALSAVPRALREAGLASGATRLEVALQIVVPAALSGISAAFILAASRAIGETMIVAIAAGAGPAFTFNPFNSAETMTGHIVRISGGDLSYDSLDYNSIFAIGLLLFTVTLGLNILSQWIVRRYREAYE